MKQKYIWITAVLLGLFLNGHAQIKKDDPVEKKMAYARFLLDNKINTGLHKKAFGIVKECAATGYAPAMNALGVLYKDGTGTEEDLQKAISCFEESSKAGCPKGYYNLHLLYRFGIGVKQNFGTAQEYLLKAAGMDYPKAFYGLGYNAYKGLGCRQDYEKAAGYFTRAADKGEAGAMYMLGLCYRNGYGVARNTGEAAFWLEKAAHGRSYSALGELNAGDPENPVTPVMLRRISSRSKTDDLQQFKTVKHRQESDLSGEYSGTLVTYDWSGKHIIRESGITLNIEQSGKDVSIRWEEENTEPLQIEAQQTDTALIFSGASYKKETREEQGNKMMMNFTQATISSLQNGDELQLTGNLQFFLPELREPGQPMYLAVSRKKEITGVAENRAGSWTVYPNPFTDRCNLSFTLSGESECRITVYDPKGKEIYAESLGTLPAGHHNYALETDLPSGVYILKFSSEGVTRTQQIIRR